jgi:hypothetical protein
MFAGARTFGGNCAFLISYLKAHSPGLGGLGLRSSLFFARLLDFFLLLTPIVGHRGCLRCGASRERALE